MYRMNRQLRIEDFVFPFGQLDKKNELAKLADLVPWDEAEKAYANDQIITVKIVDGETLSSADRWIRNLKDGQTAKISFNEKPYLERGHMYTLEFETNTTQGQETMALLFTRSSGNSQTAVVNDSAVDEHISAKVYVRK